MKIWSIHYPVCFIVFFLSITNSYAFAIKPDTYYHGLKEVKLQVILSYTDSKNITDLEKTITQDIKEHLHNLMINRGLRTIPISISKFKELFLPPLDELNLYWRKGIIPSTFDPEKMPEQTLYLTTFITLHEDVSKTPVIKFLYKIKGKKLRLIDPQKLLEENKNEDDEMLIITEGSILSTSDYNKQILNCQFNQLSLISDYITCINN